MAVKDDLKNLNAMVQNMEQQIGMFEDMVNSSITMTYNFDLKIKDELNKLSVEEITNMDSSDVLRLLNDTSSENVNNVKSMDAYVETCKDNEEYSELSSDEIKKKILLDIKNTLDEIKKLKSEKDKIITEANSAYENYFNYVNSAEYKEKKRQKLEELKSKAELEENEFEKKRIMKKLDTIEKSETLSFITERLEKYGSKEASNIVDIFFDQRRSSMVMDKFKSRLPRYGYNEEIYKRFLNLEEMFLPDEYKDLNNIFLFHVMRFISFTDTYSQDDTVFVSAILIKMYNLVYHKFETTEMENEFVEFIKKVDDYFMPYNDRFVKYNTTSPNHPERQERDRQYEEKRRMMIITSLQNEGIEPDTTLDTETLRSMLQDVIDKKEKEVIPEETEVESAEEILDSIPTESNDETTDIEEVVNSNADTELTNADLKPGDIEDIIETVESSELIDELDNFAESLGGTLVPQDEHEVEELRITEVSESEDTGVNTPMIEATTEDLASMVDDIEIELVAYKDGYGNYYIESPDNDDEYRYCDKTGEILEDTIYNKETILRLVSTNSVEKCTLIL